MTTVTHDRHLSLVPPAPAPSPDTAKAARLWSAMYLTPQDVEGFGLPEGTTAAVKAAMAASTARSAAAVREASCPS